MKACVARAQKGAALLETIAAAALAAAVIATNASVLATTARTLEASQRRWSMQSAARNALQIEAAVACSSITSCPDVFDCKLSRRAGGVPGVMLLRSTVEDKTGRETAGVAFAMLLKRSTTCPG